jgi:plasmid replication initiation protein
MDRQLVRQYYKLMHNLKLKTQAYEIVFLFVFILPVNFSTNQYICMKFSREVMPLNVALTPNF